VLTGESRPQRVPNLQRLEALCFIACLAFHVSWFTELEEICMSDCSPRFSQSSNTSLISLQPPYMPLFVACLLLPPIDRIMDGVLQCWAFEGSAIIATMVSAHSQCYIPQWPHKRAAAMTQ
jgi:hypothetical protein